MKNLTIALIITALLITLCGVATAETYEVEAVVVGYQIAFADVWEVTAVTADGNAFGWFADNGDGEYWHIGDVVLMTMMDCGREEDDEVMDVVLIGELTPMGVARWLNWQE